MGEAKRRRDYERAHAVEIAHDLALQAERYALIEEVAATDPEGLDPGVARRLDDRLDELNRALAG